MGLIENLKSLVSHDVKLGAEQVSERDILFLDPNNFPDIDTSGDKASIEKQITSEHIARFLEQTLPQTGEMPFYASITAKDVDAHLTSYQHNLFKETLASSLSMGPLALIHEEQQDICVINLPKESFNFKPPLLMGSALKKTPGWEDHWERITGIHEGAHCNQTLPENYNNLSQKDQDLVIFKHEVDADRTVVAWLKENGLDDIAQTLQDYRALNSRLDSIHATSIFFDGKVELDDITMEHIDAARTFEDHLAAELGNAFGGDIQTAQAVLMDDPKEAVTVLNQLLDNHIFDPKHNPRITNPYVQDYAKDFIGALERQLNALQPEQKLPQQPKWPSDKLDQLSSIQGGSIEIIQGNTEDQTLIGGVPAPLYFASVSDPALAQQRLEASITPHTPEKDAPAAPSLMT